MDEREEIRQLIEEILDALEQALSEGEEISDEMYNDIADIIEAGDARIEELNSAQVPPPDQQGNPPNPPSTPSTNLGISISPDAQLLWILAGQNEQAFLQYLTTFPTEETQALLRNPNELERVVGYLNQMMPQGEPISFGGMPHADLNSSTIWGTQYDPKSKQMKVRFQGGAEYVYQGIPPNIYKAFSQGQASAKTKGQNEYGAWWVGKNPSLGAALNQYIKAGGFPYQRIN